MNNMSRYKRHKYSVSCPHCGDTFDPTSEDSYGEYWAKGDSYEAFCDVCNRKFEIIAKEVSITFSVKKKKGKYIPKPIKTSPEERRQFINDQIALSNYMIIKETEHQERQIRIKNDPAFAEEYYKKQNEALEKSGFHNLLAPLLAGLNSALSASQKEK